jgi:predicted membrane channel-forming protein YqfA (hemolysin III family)
MTAFAVEWGTGQVLLSVLWLAGFVIWAWLAVVVFADLFASRDLSGGAKALWVLCVVLLPLVGVVVYVMVRVRDRPLTATGFTRSPARVPEAPRSAYVMTPDVVTALDRLNARRDAGEVTADEYRQQRSELLA